MPQRCGITFLTDATIDEIQKVFSLIEYANKTIDEYFGIITSFDILICRGSWEMEVQVISRKQSKFSATYDDTKSIGITDYRLEEIVIRYDIAKFGHYLHELIHGIISKIHPHQLREGLAWYFTLKLTEEYRYVRPPCPSWVNEVYIYPTKRLAEIVGDDFLKDLAIGKALVQHELLPKGVQDLFLPEEVFYSKMTFYHGGGGGS
jgi:hypothetical protein